MNNSKMELIKVDRNGSKHWRGRVQCDRCGGAGYYAIGVCNGEPVLSPLDAGVCWKCNGAGWVIENWIERTPEYQAKLDAKREAKRAARQAELDAQAAEIARKAAEEEAKRKADEEAESARIAAEKARSQYVGEVGQKVTVEAVFLGSPHFERHLGWTTEPVYIHGFRDKDGNKLVWKTSKWLNLDEGQKVTITGTVKEHSEYREEKQTSLLRCKIQ